MREIQKKIGASEPYICGGTPRDCYLKRLENITDLDITTGDKSVEYLSSEFGAALGKKYNVTRRFHDDGHSSIHIGSFKIDFSSNFNTPGIDGILIKMGITHPSEMQKEMFSRDFTCNALLLSLDLKNLIDPTHRGFDDINHRKIKTCLSPEITLTSNKNRVVRAIYLASKLNFDIDQSIIDFVSQNPSSIKISTEKSLSEKLNGAFKYDPDKASYYLSKMNLWKEIPITEVMWPFYMKAQAMPKKAYFQGGGGVNEPAPKQKKYKPDPAIVNQTRFKEPFYKNYDVYDILEFDHIGPGAGWHSMQKYKSISEFLDAKRKKMKDKYEADDSWIDESDEITKKNPIKTRAKLLYQLTKMAIDFPIDEQIGSNPILETDYSGSDGFPRGLMSLLPTTIPNPDVDGKTVDKLNFGRDLEPLNKSNNLLEELLNTAPPSGIFGLPDGVDLPDEDAGDPNNINPYYGTLGPNSLMYEDKWNI